MNKIGTIASFAFGLVFIYILGADIAHAQNTTYELIEGSIPLGSNGTVEISQSGFTTYIRQAIQLTIGIATVLSVVSIVIGGVQYMTTEAIQGKSDAKDRIQRAIGGLLLALSAFVILNTINPSLVEIRGIRNVNVEVESSEDDAATVSSSGSQGWKVDLADGNTQSGFATARRCARWVESNNKGDEVTKFCYTDYLSDSDFVSDTDTSGWYFELQNSGERRYFALYETCTAVKREVPDANDPANCRLNDNDNDIRAIPCEGCNTINNYESLRDKMKGTNIDDKQCQWEYDGDSNDVGGGYKLLAGNGNIDWIPQTPVPYTNFCRANNSLLDKMRLLAEDVEANDELKDFVITEAWPPEVTHNAVCHREGQCLDVSFADGVYNAESVAAFIVHAKNEINSSLADNNGYDHFLSPVFETTDQDLCREIKSREDVAGNDLEYLPELEGASYFAPHFSIYNDNASAGRGCE